MKKTRHTWLNKAYLIAISAFMFIYLSGCGAEDKNTTNQKEFVYVAEYQKVNNEDNSIRKPVIIDDSIYYISNSYNEETQVVTYYLCQLKIGESEVVKTQLDFGEDTNISELNVDTDGNLQLAILTYIYDEETGEPAAGTESAEDAEPVEDTESLEDAVSEEGTEPVEDAESEEGTEPEEDAESEEGTKTENTTVSVGRVTTIASTDYEYTQPTSQKTEICKISPEGKILSSIDISKSMENLENPYIQYLLIDNAGNIYINCDQTILVMDQNGSELLKLETDTWINNMFSAKDGTVFVTYYGQENLEVCPIDLEKKSLGEAMNNVIISPYDSYIFDKGIDTDILFSDDSALYTYNIGDESPIEILNWIDSDINRNELLYFTIVPDGRVLVINSYNEDDQNIMELTYLTKKKGSEVPEKKILTYATMMLDYNSRKQVIQFNKTNQEYRIEVKEYINSSEDYEVARTQYSTALVGGNAPDIMDISFGEMRQYMDKGILEDLNLYLDKDPELNREDYLENVLNAFGADGKLYAISPYFYINTIAARVSDVGNRNSITSDELMQMVVNMPDNVDLYEYSSKSSVLMNNIMMNMDIYIDWSTGECKFNGDEFIKALEFSNEFPMEYDFNQDGPSVGSRLKDGTLMMLSSSVSSVQDYQMMELIYGEPITFIGYPTNKENGSFISNSGSLIGMNAKSKNKDGVWQFLRMSITKEAQERNDDMQWGFPIMKSAMEERFIEDMTEEYYELPDGTKEIRPKSTWGGYYGENIEVYAATEEQVEFVRDFIKSVDTIFYYDEEINNIIQEETAAYFEGQKSPKEVAEIIQNRIQIYVSENR